MGKHRVLFLKDFLSFMWKTVGGDGMSKETPCPVCGWWNETNDACIYHPDSVEVKA
tara:strand:+ start:134 stop:301 length:168 start_codon:yes stop_codon:yes gene_type:complete